MPHTAKQCLDSLASKTEIGLKPKNRDRLTSALKYLSLRAPEGCVAIRHPVSLRGTFAALSVDSAETVSVRFLAEFTLNEVNALGMTFQVRLLRFTRNDDSYLCSWAGCSA